MNTEMERKDNQQQQSGLWRKFSNLIWSAFSLREGDARNEAGFEYPIHGEVPSRVKIERGHDLGTVIPVSGDVQVLELKDIPIDHKSGREKKERTIDVGIDDKADEFIKGKKQILRAPSVKEKTYSGSL